MAHTQKNTMYVLRDLLTSDRPQYTSFMNIGCPFSAEIFAHAGYKIVAVDCQHSPYTEDTAWHAFQAIQTAQAIPIARARWNDPAHIMRLLDFGAMGIICPMVNTAQQVQDFVKACRYSPRGNRSFGPVRSSVIHGADYHTHANDAIVTIAMIETREAYDNLDAILDTPELDGIFVGPNDLGVDTGFGPVLDSDNMDFDAMITHIAKCANAKGKIASIFTGTPKGAIKRRNQGFNVFIVSNEATILKQASAQLVQDLSAL